MNESDQLRVLERAVSTGCVMVRVGDPNSATQDLDVVKRWLRDGVDFDILRPVRN